MAWMSHGCDAGREDVLFQNENTLFCLLTIVEPTGSGGYFYAPLATGGRARGPPSEPVGPQDQQAYRRRRFLLTSPVNPLLFELTHLNLNGINTADRETGSGDAQFFHFSELRRRSACVLPDKNDRFCPNPV